MHSSQYVHEAKRADRVVGAAARATWVERSTISHAPVSTTPYDDPSGGPPRYFRSVLTLNTVQSFIAALAAFAYLFSKRRRGQSIASVVGLETQSWPLLGRLLQCSVVNSMASPLTFASLRHIDYPTMILAKSCKLIPVMLMNVVLYRRKFAAHKYLVVAMVTLGISIFMLGAPSSPKHSKGGQSNSAIGLVLLFLSLTLDGVVNSSQDEVFSRFKLSGCQMMFWMNAFSTLITLIALVTPLPPIPFISPPSATSRPEIAVAADFIKSHPKVLRHIVEFGLAGAFGQLFIFDTIEHFGSLTLVTITVTRKLMTMLLSVVVYKHQLAPAQWLGVVFVFAAIGIEAQGASSKTQELTHAVKRKSTLNKALEQEAARVKAI